MYSFIKRLVYKNVSKLNPLKEAEYSLLQKTIPLPWKGRAVSRTLVFWRHVTTNHSLNGLFIGGAKLNVRDGFELYEPGRVVAWCNPNGGVGVVQ